MCCFSSSHKNAITHPLLCFLLPIAHHLPCCLPLCSGLSAVHFPALRRQLPGRPPNTCRHNQSSQTHQYSNTIHQYSVAACLSSFLMALLMKSLIVVPVVATKAATRRESAPCSFPEPFQTGSCPLCYIQQLHIY